WLKHKETGTLSKEEVDAWGDVETASQKFMGILARIEKIKNPEDLVNDSEANQKGEPSQAPAAVASGEQPQPDLQQNAHQQVGIVQNEFLKLRMDLDNATEKLKRAVTLVQQDILNEFASQEQRAATEIKRTTWLTLALGLVVATLTLIFARNQIFQLRQ